MFVAGRFRAEGGRRPRAVIPNEERVRTLPPAAGDPPSGWISPNYPSEPPRPRGWSDAQPGRVLQSLTTQQLLVSFEATIRDFLCRFLKQFPSTLLPQRQYETPGTRVVRNCYCLVLWLGRRTRVRRNRADGQLVSRRKQPPVRHRQNDHVHANRSTNGAMLSLERADPVLLPCERRSRGRSRRRRRMRQGCLPILVLVGRSGAARIPAPPRLHGSDSRRSQPPFQNHAAPSHGARSALYGSSSLEQLESGADVCGVAGKSRCSSCAACTGDRIPRAGLREQPRVPGGPPALRVQGQLGRRRPVQWNGRRVQEFRPAPAFAVPRCTVHQAEAPPAPSAHAPWAPGHALLGPAGPFRRRSALRAGSTGSARI
jgi:hypothetical protein